MNINPITALLRLLERSRESKRKIREEQRAQSMARIQTQLEAERDRWRDKWDGRDDKVWCRQCKTATNKASVAMIPDPFIPKDVLFEYWIKCDCGMDRELVDIKRLEI